MTHRRRGDEIFAYNHTSPGDTERRGSLLAEVFGSVGERTVLRPRSTRRTTA
ncbi:maltose acetyltransferase domain-containing protein, partial [Streptomyces sp. NPDC057074]|uniref:maltose acetyltransferase domain-containing protein n=1 Tax=Streptomyces sp. NPDC057074 TaxID=3346015 RepID=UPI003636D7AF